ncbi:bifunctional 2-C-methyl-D-erythritol 4-phosphate cytidylyltransferase/2-C-methyl-D-erythritol 2,4-cyclodiphosphate synthase [Aureimonas psammosilenae]|uniref:bifunctional 2-C-methyl-D-erythritol 4-phosphate cytidylyltransferase/2-C-methyl-D-erythritol 2,4-cyclodiphosphate synthase n=1 Tax=Aureimonas psammosilenae TaxID=2495496 RepID=UPI001260DC69|nr:bifunctional 2-C-methyl-D-erythritol 4-phosphate cytidylyltransferase/2-C-methyl-D-erythritol 2,4-cyclodiphosphate synthase [Aureimonas psammosilenae]
MPDFPHREALSIVAIIVAAGRGMRAGPPFEEPKQFRLLAGRTVLQHAATRLSMSDIFDAIIVVVHPDDLDRAKSELAHLPSVRFALGGATRQQSVRAGLEVIAEEKPDIVLVHDAARPFVDAALIARVVDAVSDGTAALPALAVADTLKRTGNDMLVEATVDRRSLFAAQTPQGFPFALILDAHRRAAAENRHDFTDDTAVAEWAGCRVRIVEGSTENVKLTYPADFRQAEAKLRMIDVRTGNGYDVHQLVAGDHVTLCGVRIPHDQSLAGHSDADVGLHALTDALLATCGAGDIGVHFPPSDERWRGAASHIFVRHAVEIVRRNGGRICNVDVTLIAEAPKIMPHRDAMMAALADMTGLDATRVSVKATTNETIGFIGRREGIAAIATASVSYGEAVS